MRSFFLFSLFYARGFRESYTYVQYFRHFSFHFFFNYYLTYFFILYVPRSSRAESAISNQHFEVQQENICATRVSRASNSPWYESQRGYSVPLDSELPTELPIVDLPPEVELEHEVLDDEVDVDDHVDNDIVQVVENLKQPVNTKKR